LNCGRSGQGKTELDQVDKILRRIAFDTYRKGVDLFVIYKTTHYKHITLLS